MQTATEKDTKKNTGVVSPALAAYSDIFEQYATDAAFLWLLRSQVVNVSTLYTQSDIDELDQRISGHLDGLCLAGNPGWEICLQQLEYEESAETFVAAVIALQSGDAAKIKLICDMGLDNPDMTPGLISAFGWINKVTAQYWVERFLSVNNSKYRYLGVAISSIRRLDPQQHLTNIMKDVNTSKHPQLYARALRLIGEIKRIDLVPALNQAMDDEDENIVFWANWSAVLLGNKSAVNNLKPYALQESALQDRAIELICNILTIDQAKNWISEISTDPEQLRTVIKSTGLLGDPHAVPWLIQLMNDKLYSRLAGRSFSLITGIDLEQYKLDKEVDVSFEDDLETDVEDDAENPDSDLSWPDSEKVKVFWDNNKKSLQSGQCYLLGKPVSSETLKQILKTGNQLEGNYAALKLAILESNSILYNKAIPAVSL